MIFCWFTTITPIPADLYTPDIRLTQDGGALDRRRERFGFREFWIEGTKFVLNGIPMTFLGTRAQGVPGMCPWVVTESGPFPVDYYSENPRFFAVNTCWA